MEAPIRNVRATDQERFWAKVDKSGDCWNWQAATMRGYGIFRIDGGNQVAHRISYKWAHGSIPAQAEVDHTCFNRGCVNPAHLRLLDHQENGQNRSSANSNSKTGVRGVYWNEARSGYMCAAYVRERIFRFGPFDTIEEAEATIVAWRRVNMPASINDQRKAG
ncbi:hypothetical protein NS184_15540 [Curtobacterium luteum]|uniref:HNH nuclease domain-containing protein n=2 Tax=Curtobacterium luteum TaxID=33881 RepID=A0A175RGQ8_9MICO|nr:hypothetical protein NS184_15540 [Curtobacterium luteum]